MIKQLREKLDKGLITSEQLFKEANELAHKYQEEYNSFVTIIDKFECKEKKNFINGNSLFFKR